MEGDTGGGVAPFVIVGRVCRPHGVRGEVVVEPLTDSPVAVLGAGRRLFGGTTSGDMPPRTVELHVRSASPFKDGFIVTFDEVGDFESADRWRGRYLLLPRDELPAPESHQVYVHDLVGLRVEQNGTELGVVDGFYEMAQGLMLEVRTGERNFLLPYREEFVRHVDMERGVIVVALPEGFPK